jgi:predicted transcriptional regulator of viral defense system
MRDVDGPHAPKRHARLAALAGRQWAAISRRQLLALGVTTDEIRRMLERGLLIGLHRGVYVLGALSPAPEQRWAAALLAAGPGAALSHTSAAGVHGLLPFREVIDVVAPKQRRGDKRLRVHRGKAGEVTTRRGLNVTTVSQTLLDLAAANWPIDRLTQEAAATNLVPPR